jgi:peptidoglycan/xylan/chitin deacetylase (PgdA/CDA1 family)
VRSPRPRTLTVTFDDAYRSIPELALPVLDALGVPATVFVPTGDSGKRPLRAWPELDRWVGSRWEDELRGATWDELGPLLAAGWEIGSHTRTHPHLTEVDDEALWTELAGSLEDCVEATGVPCRSIAYPFGEADARVAAAAKRAGYEAGALLTDALPPRRRCGPDPMMVPRLGVYEKDQRLRLRLKSEMFLHSIRVWNLAQSLRRAVRR